MQQRYLYHYSIRGLLEKALNSIEDYINIVVSNDKQKEIANIKEERYQQITFKDL